MTGYGRAEGMIENRRVAVEIYSVNRRQGEIQVAAPNELSGLEVKIREYVGGFISRGQVTVKISLGQANANICPIKINHKLAKSYAREFKALGKETGLGEQFNLDLILRAPGVMESQFQSADSEKLWKKLKIIIDKALKQFIYMRTQEGKHLEADLKLRVKNMEKALKKVKERAPQVVEKYKTQLIERIKNSGLQVTQEDRDRLLKEVVIFADRCDISEEIARLESHFKKFYDYIKRDEPVGRTLDFLAQEMNREINTIGSKANDSLISHQVVTLKTELEKFREQVQNVE